MGIFEPHTEIICTFRIVVTIILLFVIIFVLVDVFVVSEEPYNLVSAAGIIVYILLFYIFSYNPAKVRGYLVIIKIGFPFLLFCSVLE